MNKRDVTIADFIQPRFHGADPKDYEIRADGEIVRKDRWEKAIYSIRAHLCEAELMPDALQFEIEDVVCAVKSLIINHKKGNENGSKK